MSDQSTNRKSARISSQNPPSRNPSSHNLPPLQQSTRVTRSRSRDISDAEAIELVPSRKRRKAGDDEKKVVDSGAQVNRLGKRGIRSKNPQGLPAVTEESDVVNAHLLLNEAGQVDSVRDKGAGDHGRILPQPESPPLSSAIFGTNARNSQSIQIPALLNPMITHQETDMEEAAMANSPADNSIREFSAVELKRLIPEPISSRISKISFNASKNIKLAARRLHERKSESSAVKALPRQQQDQEEIENTRTTESTAVAETTAVETMSPGVSREEGTRVSATNRSQSALGRQNQDDDTWRPQDFADDDEEVLAVSEKPSASDSLARAQQVLGLQASRDVENSRESISNTASQPISRVKKHFTDPQPNAQRISFDSQESVQPDSEKRGQHLPRREDSADVEVSSEEGEELSSESAFQSDQREITRQTRRGRTLSGRHPALVPSARRHLPTNVRVTSTHGSASDEIKSSASRHNHDQNAAPSQFENYMKANRVAKFHTSRMKRPPQIRRAWTKEETEALLELVEKYGTSWAYLKQRDELERLKGRDQVALKDKARQMKFDFLKAGTLMPQNFRDIPLNRVLTDKLRNMGIEYQVRRATEDED